MASVQAGRGGAPYPALILAQPHGRGVGNFVSRCGVAWRVALRSFRGLVVIRADPSAAARGVERCGQSSPRNALQRGGLGVGHSFATLPASIPKSGYQVTGRCLRASAEDGGCDGDDGYDEAMESMVQRAFCKES